MKRQGKRAFRKDEHGIAAVEFALILPILLMILVGIIDFGSLYFLRNNMVTVARESTRALAVQSVTAAEAEQMVKDRLAGWSTTFTVVAEEPVAPNTDVTVTVSVPMVDVAPIGFVFGMTGYTGNLQAQVAMRQEG